jgi:glycosyltransferase involved in cell wall biosynthesis
MNIAMYHCRLPDEGRKPGGAEIYVDRLASALGQRGHEVEVWTFVSPPSKPHYQVRRLRPRQIGEKKVLRQYVAPWLLNAHAFKRFEVMHLFGDDWFYLRRRLPTVRTFLGSAVFEAATATSLKRRLDQRALFALEQVSARLATACYGIGLDSELLYPTEGVLPSGVEGVPAEMRQPADDPTILFVGTWHGRKRGRLLHDLFQSEIRPQIPNAQLWMVADAAPETVGVTWFPHPTDAELHDLYRRAWIFCLPSRYEGFGLPYLEAAAHGMPVVSTPNSGALALMGTSEDGLAAGVVVSDERLSAALIRLLDSEDLRQELGARARKRARDFGWDRAVELHERAYQLAIERWAATS